MKNEKRMESLVSLLILIAGVILIIWPEKSLNFIAEAISVLCICVGVLILLSYLINRETRGISQWKLVVGILFVLVGMFVLPKLGIVLAVIPVILGLWIVCSGVTKLIHGFNYRKTGYPLWWLPVAISVVGIILGGIIVINPFGTIKLAIRVVGVVLVFDNIGNVFDSAYIGYKLQKDGYVVVDADDDVIDIIQK